MKTGVKLNKNNARDDRCTPLCLAYDIIESIPWKTNEKVLEPCKGRGAIYNQLPYTVNKDWCEIKEGKDFFKYERDVDTIIMNPPMSKLDLFIDKCIELKARRICMLLPHASLTHPRLMRFEDYDYGITKIDVCKVHEWFGHTLFIVFEKDEPTIVGIMKRYREDEVFSIPTQFIMSP